MIESADTAFLRSILAAPDDDTPRLVYADYLEEHRQPERAEFIRIQCDLAHMPSFHPHRSGLVTREQELLGRYLAEWKGQLPAIPGVHWEAFERGFVTGLRVEDPRTLFTWADEIFAAAPIQRLALHQLNPTTAQQLAQFSPLRAIRTLDLEDGNRIGNSGLEALADSPHLTRLRQLKLRENNLGPAGVHHLANSPVSGNLILLDLDHNALFDEAAHALGASSGLKNLAILSLGWTRLGNRGVTILAQAPHLNRLSWLYLTDNDVDDDGATALATAKWNRLQALYLANNRIGDRGAVALAQSPILEHLRCLYLKHNRIQDEGALALAESPYLEEVNELILSENPISAEAGDVLRRRFGRRVWLW